MKDNHPEAIFIQLHTYCNATCLNCPHPFTYKTLHPKGRMSDATWRKILNDIIEMDYKGQVGFYLHHEPLLDKTLFDKIKDINRKTNAHVVLSTNAGLLTEKKAKLLVESNPRRVHININSGNKIEYESSMKLNYDTTIKNAKYFIELAKGKIELEINCPVMEGFDVVSLKSIFPDTKVNTEYWANSRGGLLPEIAHYEKENRFKLDNYCTQPSQNFNILYDGSTIVCCNDWMHESKKDSKNIHDSSILEIYNRIKKLEYTFKKGDYSKYRMCKICSKEMSFYQNARGGKLNVLITNHHLSGLTGSENLTLTLAKELSNQGHLVTVYSKFLNPQNLKNIEKSVKFVDDLNCIKNELFDIAHVHHNISAIEIRNAFHKLPMVVYSQGVTPFLEQPTSFDVQVSRYLALSEEIRENLKNYNIENNKIQIVKNLIDVDKFTNNSSANKFPISALVINRNIDAEKENIIKTACEQLNIYVEFVGGIFGEVSQDELKVKIEMSDLVFSVGRGALEAMIGKRAVIVFNRQGADGMVLPETYEEISKNNFSGRRYAKNYTISELAEEIKKYDLKKIEEVSNRVRIDYSSKLIAKQLVQIYKNVLAENVSIEMSLDTKNKLSEITNIINESIVANNGIIWQNKIIPEQMKRENELLEIAEKLIENNNTSAAKLVLVKALEQSPNNLNLLNDLAVAEIMEENFESAFKIISKVLSIDKLNEIANGNIEYLNSIAEEYKMDKTDKIKPIAIYLPQFHPIPENDKAWGKGFTEWTNVTKATPLYPDHYQPHIPLNNNYYDLRSDKIREEQIELAKEHGIYGFCYYHYWFNGKEVLETPIKKMLDNKDLDFPFCICWANENWTKRWDGLDDEIIIPQSHSHEDDYNFIHSLFPYFSDERYMTINGKPLLIIYRTELFPDIKKTSQIWREETVKAGFEGLYLVRVEGFIRNINPSEIGFDASMEFAPDFHELGKNLNENGNLLKDIPELRIFNYKTMMSNMINRKSPPYKLFRSVTPFWDNTPRRGAKGLILAKCSPSDYEYWLTKTIDYTEANREGEEKIIFINAWNEWGEGNHLEPDEKHKTIYLEKTKKAIDAGKYKYKTLRKAEKLIEEENYIDAKKYLQNLLEIYSDSTEVYNDLAVISILENNFRDALTYIKQVLTIDPKNEIAIGNFKFVQQLNIIELDENKKHQNESSFPKERNIVYDDRTTSFQEQIQKAEELIKNHKLSQAESILKNVLSNQKDNLEALNDLSVISIMKEDYEYAINYIDSVLQLDSKNEIAIENLAFIEQTLDKDYNKVENDYIITTDNQNITSVETDVQKVEAKTNEFDLSIIIPVYNNIELTLQCLDSIEKTAPKNLNYEVIIVDDASTDDVKSAINNYSGNQVVRLLSNSSNSKFAVSCNNGAEDARGKVLVFLNNDTIALEDWLNSGYYTLLSDSNIGIVGAKLLYPDNTIQHAGVEFHVRKNHYLPLWPYHIHRNLHTNAEQVNQQKEYPAVTGACLFIEKKLFNDVNGFDENYGMYFEDVDLCFKVSELKKRIVYEPSCTLYHLEGKSSPDKSAIDELNVKSSMRFYDKWRSRINLMRKKEIGNSVYWLSPIFNPSGYASEAIGFALGLDSYVDLTIRHQNRFLSDNFIKNMPDIWKEKLFRLHVVNPYDWNKKLKFSNKPITIQHQPANAFYQILESHYNIGRTMYETDRVPTDWIEKCNMMDEIWVPSQFNKETFINSGVAHDKIEIIPEGIDTTIFNDEGIQPIKLPNKASFNFLSIFEWTNRKGWDVLLKAYFEAFSNQDDVCLYLRTYLLSNYDSDTKSIISKKIDSLIRKQGYKKTKLPRYEILTNQLPLNDLLRLYKAADAFVLPSRGEGWGRPYMEAMAMGLPVIGTNWSGNTAFMTNENSYLINVHKLVKITENEIESYIGHRWAEPSKNHLIKLMRDVFKNPKQAKIKGIKAKHDIQEKFSLDAVARITVKRLETISKNYAKPKYERHFKNIVWEGDQFVYHSLANINREICNTLINERYNLSIKTTKKSGLENKLLKENSKIIHASSKSFNSCDIHISHQWPPRLDPPPSGRWIVIQPWEFGSTPKVWVSTFNNYADEIWVPSSFVKNIYTASGVKADKVFVIPNGFSKDKFHPNVIPYKLKTKKKFKFLFVGGTIYRKGIDLLLNAYFETFTNKDDVCLVIKDFGVNSFYNGQTIKEKLKEYKLQENSPEFEYIDKNLSDDIIASIYTACDVLVHPYRGEGFGMPVLEAMACGRSVIVTKGGSTDDFCDSTNSLQIKSTKKYFKENKVDNLETVGTPWLLEPDYKSLIEQMVFAFNNQDKIKNIGKKATKFVSEYFTWDKIFSMVETRIDEIIQKPITRFLRNQNYQDMTDTTLFESILLTEIRSAYEDKDYSLALNGIRNLFNSKIMEHIQKDSFLLSELLQISGYSNFYLENYDLALKSFNSLLKLNPKLGKAHEGLGDVAQEKELFQEAKTMYEWAIKNGENRKEVWDKLSIANTKLGLEPEDYTLELSEVEPSPTLQDAEELINNSDLNGALKILSQLLKQNPSSTDVLNDLAVVKIMQNELEEALNYINNVIKLDPQNEIAIENLNYIESQVAQ